MKPHRPISAAKRTPAGRCYEPNTTTAASLAATPTGRPVLYGRQKGRRVAVYVPEKLVPEVQRGLDNGRALQELLQQAAPRYVKALKRERTKAPKSKKS